MTARVAAIMILLNCMVSYLRSALLFLPRIVTSEPMSAVATVAMTSPVKMKAIQSCGFSGLLPRAYVIVTYATIEATATVVQIANTFERMASFLVRDCGHSALCPHFSRCHRNQILSRAFTHRSRRRYITVECLRFLGPGDLSVVH